MAKGQTPRPPASHLVGIRPVEVEEGGVTMSIPNLEWWCNPARMVYGGITSNLIHDAMAMALHSTLPKATTCATLDLTVNFVRPVPPDGEQLLAKSHVVHCVRTFAVTSGQVINAKGKTVATGSASWIILEGWPFPDQRDYAREFPPTN
jgi:acyl-CoA thioesterase